MLLESLTRRREWAAAQPDAPLWPGGPTPTAYVEGMARPTGSHIVEANSLEALERLLAACDADGKVKAIPQDELPAGVFVPGHEYFTCQVPLGYTALLGACYAGSLTDEELSAVRVVRGAHGIELQLRKDPQPTYELSFIMDADGLVTWYPGTFTARCDLGYATVKFTR
jgi:hypothetical protein